MTPLVVAPPSVMSVHKIIKKATSEKDLTAMGNKDNKKGGKKGGGGNKAPMSEEDMRKMGFSDEQIAGIMAERGMSTEEKAKQAQEAEAKKRAGASHAKFAKAFAELLEEEATDRRLHFDNDEDREREALHAMEQEELEPVFKKWQIEVRRERLHKEAQRNRETRENAKARFLEQMGGMSEEERKKWDEMTVEQQKKEQEETESRFEAEHAAKLEKAEADEKAAAAAKKKEEVEAGRRAFFAEMKEKGIDVTSDGQRNDGEGKLDAADAKELAFLGARRAM